MFDIGFWELLLVGVVALLVVGPERLPRLARTTGAWLGRARSFLQNVKADVDREMREADMASTREAARVKEDVETFRRDVEEGVGAFRRDVENAAGADGGSDDRTEDGR